MGFFGFATNFFKAVWAEKKRATKSSGQFALMAALRSEAGGGGGGAGNPEWKPELQPKAVGRAPPYVRVTGHGEWASDGGGRNVMRWGRVTQISVKCWET